MEKPVNLQINDSGAWRQVVSFDAADEALGAKVMAHAADLAGVVNPKARLRIAMKPFPNSVLLYWDALQGWHEPKRLQS